MEEGRGQRSRHPMGVVVERTGLSAHVLRAWERRYGAVEPGRTGGGQRLYSDADVLRLRLLKRATEGGRPIGTVARLGTDELVELVGEEAAAGAHGPGGPGLEGVRGVAGDEGDPWTSPAGVSEHLRSCLAAADRMDAAVLRAELMRAVVKLSAPVFVTAVVAPLLERVGDLWESGALRPAQEHVVSTAVRQVLDWVLGRYEAPAEAPLVVVGTPAGELHEFGAMMAAVIAADAGWRVLYLGPSLPADEIAVAAERAGAGVVALSVVDGVDEDGARAGREVSALRSRLAPSVLLVTGGRRSGEMELEGVTRVAELNRLREVLSAAGPSPRASSRASSRGSSSLRGGAA